MSSEQLNAILYITYLTGLAASQSLSHYRESFDLMLIPKRGLMELLSGAVVTFCRHRVVWNCNCQPRFLCVHLLLPLQRCPFNNYPNTLSCDGIPKQRCNHYRREVPTALPKLLLFIDIYIYIHSFIFKYIHTHIYVNSCIHWVFPVCRSVFVIYLITFHGTDPSLPRGQS